MPNGLFTQWNENGQRLEDGNYVDGQKNGKYTYWYSNGQKRQELYFKAGKREGESNVWWSNGQKKKSGKNKDDKRINSDAKVTLFQTVCRAINGSPVHSPYNYIY